MKLDVKYLVDNLSGQIFSAATSWAGSMHKAINNKVKTIYLFISLEVRYSTNNNYLLKFHPDQNYWKLI